MFTKLHVIISALQWRKLKSRELYILPGSIAVKRREVSNSNITPEASRIIDCATYFFILII